MRQPQHIQRHGALAPADVQARMQLGPSDQHVCRPPACLQAGVLTSTLPRIHMSRDLSWKDRHPS